MTTFVDTSVWFAAAAKRDHQNVQAKSILESIDRHLTSDLVLAETWHLMKAHFGSEIAETFWEQLGATGVRIESVSSADLETAAQIDRRYPQAGFSFVDRTSVALMERTGITRVATFNEDYATYRPPGTKKPFVILRQGHRAVFRALRQALLQRRPVQVSHGSEHQTVCPYIVGHAAGEERAYALVVERGQGQNGSVAAKWVCLRLSKIEDVRILTDGWIEQEYPGPVQRCVDQVDLDARHSARYF